MLQTRASTAIVFTGGDPPRAVAGPRLEPGGLVIAADSGLHHALALGWPVDLVVGDLDSVDGEALATARAAGVEIERHPTDKDATDLELALDAALRRGARRVRVVGGAGGRLDHLVAATLLLASERFADLEIDAHLGDARVAVVRDSRELRGRRGSLVSLLALGGPARCVRTTGLRFALDGEDLLPGSTRGVSNELLGDVATVALDGGVLLAVQPDPGDR